MLLVIIVIMIISYDLKTTGELHYTFRGLRHYNSQDFLLIMLGCLYEDLHKEVVSVHMMEK